MSSEFSRGGRRGVGGPGNRMRGDQDNARPGNRARHTRALNVHGDSMIGGSSPAMMQSTYATQQGVGGFTAQLPLDSSDVNNRHVQQEQQLNETDTMGIGGPPNYPNHPDGQVQYPQGHAVYMPPHPGPYGNGTYIVANQFPNFADEGVFLYHPAHAPISQFVVQQGQPGPPSVSTSTGGRAGEGDVSNYGYDLDGRPQSDGKVFREGLYLMPVGQSMHQVTGMVGVTPNFQMAQEPRRQSEIVDVDNLQMDRSSEQDQFRVNDQANNNLNVYPDQAPHPQKLLQQSPYGYGEQTGGLYRGMADRSAFQIPRGGMQNMEPPSRPDDTGNLWPVADRRDAQGTRLRTPLPILDPATKRVVTGGAPQAVFHQHQDQSGHPHQSSEGFCYDKKSSESSPHDTGPPVQQNINQQERQGSSWKVQSRQSPTGQRRDRASGVIPNHALQIHHPPAQDTQEQNTPQHGPGGHNVVGSRQGSQYQNTNRKNLEATEDQFTDQHNPRHSDHIGDGNYISVQQKTNHSGEGQNANSMPMGGANAQVPANVIMAQGHLAHPFMQSSGQVVHAPQMFAPGRPLLMQVAAVAPSSDGQGMFPGPHVAPMAYHTFAGPNGGQVMMQPTFYFTPSPAAPNPASTRPISSGVESHPFYVQGSQPPGGENGGYWCEPHTRPASQHQRRIRNEATTRRLARNEDMHDDQQHADRPTKVETSRLERAEPPLPLTGTVVCSTAPTDAGEQVSGPSGVPPSISQGPGFLVRQTQLGGAVTQSYSPSQARPTFQIVNAGTDASRLQHVGIPRMAGTSPMALIGAHPIPISTVTQQMPQNVAQSRAAGPVAMGFEMCGKGAIDLEIENTIMGKNRDLRSVRRVINGPMVGSETLLSYSEGPALVRQNEIIQLKVPSPASSESDENFVEREEDVDPVNATVPVVEEVGNTRYSVERLLLVRAAMIRSSAIVPHPSYSLPLFRLQSDVEQSVMDCGPMGSPKASIRATNFKQSDKGRNIGGGIKRQEYPSDRASFSRGSDTFEPRNSATSRPYGNAAKDVGPIRNQTPSIQAKITLNKLKLSREDLVRRKAKSLLNKLTVDNFEVVTDKLCDELIQLKDASELNAFASEVFNKAVTEPAFSEIYADLTLVLRARSPEFPHSDDPKRTQSFHHSFIDKCQDEFDKLHNQASLNIDETARATMSEDDIQIEIKRRKNRTLGNMRFIGEMFMRRVLTPKVVINVLGALFHDPEEHLVECICELLTTIGRYLEKRCPPQANEMFTKFEDLISSDRYCMRIHYKVQDLLDLRSNDWKRKVIFDDKARTIADIHKQFNVDKSRGGAPVVAQQGHEEIVGSQSAHPYKPYVEKWKAEYDLKVKQRKESALAAQAAAGNEPQ